MFGIGPMELLLILVVALLVLGPSRLPEVARTLGRGMGEFRRASNDLRQSLAIDEIQNELRDGLTAAGTIHQPVKTPQAEDTPPQAGDDLPAAASAEKDRHPGELPDDLDPHAHADAEAEPDADAAESAGADTNAPSADDAAGADGEGHADGEGEGDGAEASSEPVEDDLGAVPVGGVMPRGAKPRGAKPQTGGASEDPPEGTDGSRG